MLDLHYSTPELAELYDYSCGWSEDREFYLRLAKQANMTILDLGCGTGLICHAYAQNGHQVTGVDPAEEMLKIAKKKQAVPPIEWIQSTAQDLEISSSYDLIIMTGHAFQVLLTEEQVKQTFQNVHSLLKDNGRFVFESRNPHFDWQNHWDYEYYTNLPHYSVKESRQFKSYQEQIMTFELHYEFPALHLVSYSTLRFWQESEIQILLAESHLRTENLLGDWSGLDFNPHHSQEMIFMVERV